MNEKVSSRKAVEIGTYYSKNVDQFAEAVGLNGLTLGDTKAQIEAFVAYINTHGGLLGRPVKPIMFENDATSNENQAAIGQAICSHWTEDHKVFAATLFRNEFTHTLEACLHQRGVPLVTTSLGNFALKEHYDRWPLFSTPVYVSMDRAYRTLIRRLGAQSYFGRNAKIGLLRFDAAHHTRVAKTVLKPELARNGLTLTDEFAFSTPERLSDLGNLGPQAENAILRFRSSGVTHVLIMDIGSAIPLFFMPAAESSGYRPRYGLTTDSAPAFIAENVPPEQLRGALGIGWSYDDGLHGADQATFNTTAKLCSDILRRAGTELDASGLGLVLCDQFLFLQAAVNKGGALTPQAFQAGVHAMAKSFRSANNFGTRFAPGRHDGAALVRDIGFVGGCGCFKFRSGDQAVV